MTLARLAAAGETGSKLRFLSGDGCGGMEVRSEKRLFPCLRSLPGSFG